LEKTEYQNTEAQPSEKSVGCAFFTFLRKIRKYLCQNRRKVPSWLVERKFQILSFKSEKFSKLISKGVKNNSSRCLPIEGILRLCLERGEFLKKCGNFTGKFGKEKVKGDRGSRRSPPLCGFPRAP
jgi:hypothetical protein